ncbi:hypothetical protein PR003_g30950 [Phytophthora rubi]|uniref:Uncharacterized protein n=1 Tax=Phytophthora rubi TaxID=129364 RepID=A0A6A3H0D8_9STRA|nr:hypothetical protein PR002_g29471 [Phytophthora rubi]KAE8974692.1 hypothetical protein PR001_g25921 [Phytophthora rubi]KAE9270075.1 hypothetical protein PR003_g30950 [Phytophthora rubi]
MIARESVIRQHGRAGRTAENPLQDAQRGQLLQLLLWVAARTHSLTHSLTLLYPIACQAVHFVRFESKTREMIEFIASNGIN